VSQSVAGRVMPIIVVRSVDAIRNFYVDTLGFMHVMGMVGKDGQLDFCTVVMGGARIMFSRPKDGASSEKARSAPRPVEIYFEVANVEAYHEKLKKTPGVEIVDPLTMQWWGDRTFKVQDPAGYEVWFYQTLGEPKPPQGSKIV